MHTFRTLVQQRFRHVPAPRGHRLRKLIQHVLRVEVTGFELWQQHPGALVVANHISYADGPLLAGISPHPLTYAVTADFARHHVWRRVLDFMAHSGLGRYVAVDARTPFGMRAIIKALKTDTGAMVFPEGGVTRNGKLGPLQPGVAFAAQRTERLILPIRLSGLEHSILGCSGATARSAFPRTRVTVGSPIDPAGLGTEEILAKIAEALGVDTRR